MAKAKKLPSGNWRIRVGAGENGKSVSFTAPTKKEAEIKAAEFIASRKKLPSALSIDEAIDKYISARSNILSPSTIAGYRKIQRNWLGNLRNERLCDITNHDLQAHINAISARFSPKTVRNTFGLITAVFSEFCPEMRISVKLPQNIRKPKELPEPQRIVEAVKGTDIELPVLLGLWLGLRMSEIRGASVADVKNGILYIHQVLLDVDGQHILRDVTKTPGSTRQLRLPDYIVNLLPKDGMLTTLTASQVEKRFSALLEQNNIPHIRFHDLRHLNASLMLSLGISEKYMMERGGWSTPDIMRNVYQHTFSADRQEADKRIDDYFSSIVNQ